ncbi:hypothetical protein [Caproiciproducens faecalis]|uniref:Ig-like domain (Group 2) n=1 Tax=Caproiciproducens faecalis TaxID=2820301 RepID=A0ABS7DLQ5_9FIRM|nr:hypothetical protein [Caproiciproducens faecalis]MBW7572227.1 hypothetical protein [Caproiciproducens faecalis]
MFKNRKIAVLIPILTILLASFSAAAFADSVLNDENSAASVTLNEISLVQNTSYVSEAYFGVIYLRVDDDSVVRASTDTQGHVVVTAVAAGTTKIRYYYRTLAESDWTSATLPVTVTGTSAAPAVSSTGLVFSQSSVKIAKFGEYTPDNITLNGSKAEASSLVWVSSSTGVATVDASTGKITAVSGGTAVIYAIDPVTKAAADISVSVY